MQIKTISMSILLALGANVQAQNTDEIKVSADIQAGCNLNAENINFGVLQMPITNQSAQSYINIQCSNNTSLSLSISYGSSSNIQSGDSYTVVKVSGTDRYQDAKVYKNGVAISNQYYDYYCNNTFNNDTNNGVAFYSTEILSLLNTNKQLGFKVIDEWNLCQNSGEINYSGITNIGGITTGKLIGIKSGDVIEYLLKKPNSNDNWTTSKPYSFISNANEQKILMQAHIDSSNNKSYRMTADNYSGVMNVILTY